MAYDTGGQLSTVTLPEEPPGTPTGLCQYAYNATTGNLETITAPDGGSLTFTYDGFQALSTAWAGSTPVAGVVSSTYDNDFQITSRSVNGVDTITFGYDLDSLLTSAGDETLNYEPANELLTSTSLGAVSNSITYNSFAEVSNYTASANSLTIYQRSLIRDKLGRITQKTETVQGVTHIFEYEYDSVGNSGYLTQVVKKDSSGLILSTSIYTYGLNGNRLNNGAVYDNQDRLISTNTATYTYTNNGELLTKTENSQVTSYTYDVLGNLKEVILPSGTTISYIIDGRNRRIGKKIDGVLQQAWLYKDGLNPIVELDGAGNIVSRFVYASRANIPDYVIKGGVTYRIISDHLGSPRLIINTVDGTVIQAIEYDEWGNILSDTNPGFLPFGFVGGLYDSDTKLVRFGARDYDPETGRWTAKDPIRFDWITFNIYDYVNNDPINFVDLTGLYPTKHKERCISLEKKIAAARKQIIRQYKNIFSNPGGMSPSTGAGCTALAIRNRHTIDGHFRILREQNANLKEYQKEFKRKCNSGGGGPPGASPATAPAPTPMPEDFHQEDSQKNGVPDEAVRNFTYSAYIATMTYFLLVIISG